MSGPGPLALVVNPAATLTRGDLPERARRLLEPWGLGWSLATRGPGDAADMARRVAREGAATVVALGGDGTASEVAGALAGGPVAVAVLPGGNANVFSRALGWPARPADALAALEAALAAGRRRTVRLGLVRAGPLERVVAVSAGVGLDAETVEWIERRPGWKHRLRQVAYGVGVGGAVLRAPRRARMTVRADGGAPLAAASLLAACASPYTYLGRRPLDLAPGADFDGHIAWTAVLRVRLPELAGLMARSARGLPLPREGPALAGGLAREEVTAVAEAPVAVQADGEPLGRHHEVRVRPGPRLVALVPVPPLKSDARGPT